MGADISARDKKGSTPLHFAAGQGRLDIVKYLWSKAAEMEAEDPGVPAIGPGSLEHLHVSM